jgi:tetratricopeptide (TPR) repeat protein
MKYNFIYKISLLSLLLAFVVAGCVKKDDLIQIDPNVETEASFWKTPEDALYGLNSVYGKLCVDGTYMRSTPIMQDLRSDGLRSHSPWVNMVQCGNFTSILSDMAIYGWAYECYYNGVYRANQVLEKMTDIEMEQDFSDRVKGQALFLRGIYLMHAVKLFNNVPAPTTYQELYHEQLSGDQVWEQVISDFAEAAELLPVSYDGVTGPDADLDMLVGRATKGAAMAYLGKAYLFTKDFAKAEDQFRKVIDLGIYDLVANYRDNFTDANEYNEESLFEIGFNREVGGTDLSWGGTPIAGWGRTSAQAITYAPRGFGWTDVQPTWTLYNEYHEEATVDGELDPRCWVTIFAKDNPAPLYGQVWDSVYKDNPADLNDLFCRKYQNDETMADEFDWRSGINYRMMRYADVLMMYAECLNENGKTADAYQYIQMVRDRVNLPDLSTTKPGMTQAEMREQIGHERFLEFALEGHRWDDIRRWGWVQDPAKLAWLQERDPEFDSYVAGREYFPIPQTEVDNNPGTVQNTGW